jgi:cytosine/creatinine deaminase
MPEDLLFHNVIFENSPAPMDIAIRSGIIDETGPDLTAQGCRVIEARGMLASPLFIDPHHHLDCAFLSEPPNLSGTLEEAIQINARVKQDRTEKDVYEKACQALRLALQNGTGYIRSHTDIDSVSKLRLLQPVLEAKAKFRGIVDVQVAAFPQLGLIADPESIQLMRAALQAGADVVGGMPHAETSPGDSFRHIEILFELAEEFNVDIDMHVDETDDANSHTLELLADATLRHGYEGRVTAGHCCALAAYPEDYAARVIEKVAQARISIVTNPLVNLYLQGRHDQQPVRRGITRVKQLLEAGVNVTCGSDDISNLFFPYGRMDMLEVAMVTSIVAHLTSPEEIQDAFDMPRIHAARALNLRDYGIMVGKPANFVLLGAETAREALQVQPVRRLVVRQGQIVASRDEIINTFIREDGAYDRN